MHGCGQSGLHHGITPHQGAAMQASSPSIPPGGVVARSTDCQLRSRVGSELLTYLISTKRRNFELAISSFPTIRDSGGFLHVAWHGEDTPLCAPRVGTHWPVVSVLKLCMLEASKLSRGEKLVVSSRCCPLLTSVSCNARGTHPSTVAPMMGAAHLHDSQLPVDPCSGQLCSPSLHCPALSLTQTNRKTLCCCRIVF